MARNGFDGIYGAFARLYPEGEADPRETGPGHVYICNDCTWRDRGGALAQSHHAATGHSVRGRDWPAEMPDAVFSKGRGK